MKAFIKVAFDFRFILTLLKLLLCEVNKTPSYQLNLGIFIMSLGLARSPKVGRKLACSELLFCEIDLLIVHFAKYCLS